MVVLIRVLPFILCMDQYTLMKLFTRIVGGGVGIFAGRNPSTLKSSLYKQTPSWMITSSMTPPNAPDPSISKIAISDLSKSMS
mgnify:CR=1 FL=1